MVPVPPVVLVVPLQVPVALVACPAVGVVVEPVARLVAPVVQAVVA